MGASIKVHKVMPLIAVVCLLASLLLGVLLPLYTDEVVWRFQLSRSIFDGGVDRFIGEACGPNTLAQAPLFMQPLRLFSARANALFADPMFVRLSGVVMALVWVSLLWRLVGKIARTSNDRATMRTLVLSLAGLGVLPLQLVWSRPEQPLLITLTLALFVALRGGDLQRDSSRREAWVSGGVVVILGAIALSYHLKAVAFLPVFLVCAFYASRGALGGSARATTIVVLIMLGGIAANYWVHRFQCPGDALLRAKLQRENVAEILFSGDSPWSLIKRIAGGIFPSNYVRLSIPSQTYMSFWLPPVDSPGLVVPWRRLVLLGWYAAFAAGAVAMVLALRNAIRKRILEVRVALALVLAVTAMVWGASQIHRNAYEAAFCLPVGMLFIAFSTQAVPITGSRLFGGLGVALLIASFVSQALLFGTYAQRLWLISTTPGYVASQPFSFSAYGYRTLEPQIQAAARLCGIDRRHPVRDLLVDDLTYFSYMKSWQPLHRLGVLQVWNGSINEPLTYLHDKGSSGIIMGCMYLPPDLQARAQRVGQFCCLGAP